MATNQSIKAQLQVIKEMLATLSQIHKMLELVIMELPVIENGEEVK